MRKVIALVIGAIGVALSACGGEDNQAPKTPVAPPPTAMDSTPAPAAEAPKEESKPKESLGQLEEKSGRAMFDAMNAHDAKKLAGIYADSGVVRIAGAPADMTGRDAIEKGYAQLFGAFPDYKTAPTRVWAKNDVVVVEWAMNGTHQGDLWGVKATEKKVGLQGVDVLWFAPDGLVKEHHVYYDAGTIFSQIGMVPQKARAIPALPSGPPQVFGMGPAAADDGKNAAALGAMTTALDAKKEADFLATIADSVEYDDMTQPQTMKGKADAKKFLKQMSTGFPDAKHTTLNSWAVGDFVISEGQMTGTHSGTFFNIPATKKPVNMKSLGIFQFQDGKMVKGWNYSNGADFMMQIGKMPPPGAAKPAAGSKPVTTTKPADPKPKPAKP